MLPLPGCGFLDAIDMLVALGADLNARDITGCTPLQNAAHGTYSALAAMPPSHGEPTSSGRYDSSRMPCKRCTCCLSQLSFSCRHSLLAD
jgi:hypothetical protein